MRPLRILMVCHMPWSLDYGGPRIQMDLAEAFRQAGHTVDVFSLEQACRSAVAGWIGRRVFDLFPQRAAAYVKSHAGAYDVIDAHHCNLPYDKRSLGFRGALIARSVGLLPRYLDFAASHRPPCPWYGGKRLILDGLESLNRHRARRLSWRSFDACDAAILPNEGEAAVLRARKPGTRVHSIPFGLSPERRAALWRARRSAEDRLRNRVVVFVGTWEKRKGSADWPDIVRLVRAEVPDAQFRFLGTGVSRSRVLADLGLVEADWVTVVSRFRAHELPALLGEGTVGAFPSYLEGFGYGLLEMLAAALPSIAYRVDGPLDILSRFNDDWLVRCGDVASFSRKLIGLLTMSEPECWQAIDTCAQGLDHFRVEDAADRTLAVYESALRRCSTYGAAEAAGHAPC